MQAIFVLQKVLIVFLRHKHFVRKFEALFYDLFLSSYLFRCLTIKDKLKK